MLAGSSWERGRLARVGGTTGNTHAVEKSNDCVSPAWADHRPVFITTGIWRNWLMTNSMEIRTMQRSRIIPALLLVGLASPLFANLPTRSLFPYADAATLRRKYDD